MANEYSMDDLLDFLDHAGDKGLMATATARALAVATRNVLGILDPNEQTHIGDLDLNAVIKRFNNKRARDFSPGSLKAYDARVRRAIELYLQWKDNPANFTVKTRTVRKRNKDSHVEKPLDLDNGSTVEPHGMVPRPGTYNSSIPVGAGRIITVSNIPEDLSAAEAERVAQFIRLLVVD